MRFLTLLTWVGQFGFSIIFPTLFFLLFAVWLQQKFDLGIWIIFLLGTVGVLTTVSTTRSCLRSLRKAAEEASGERQTPVSFNDHT